MMILRIKVVAVLLLWSVSCCCRCHSFAVDRNGSLLQQGSADVAETESSSLLDMQIEPSSSSNETDLLGDGETGDDDEGRSNEDSIDDDDDEGPSHMPRRGTAAVLRDWLRKIKYKPLFFIRSHIIMGHQRSKLSAPERTIMKAYKRALPSVAALRVYVEVTDYNNTERELEEGEIACRIDHGSGFLWDGHGHIVTNHHVLFGEGNLFRVKVQFPGMSDILDVDIVGSDPERDIAVLKVSSNDTATPKLPRPIRKGSSRYLHVGQTCLAIGNIHSLSETLTRGVISGLDREERGVSPQDLVPGIIQTDGMYVCMYVCMYTCA